MKKAHEGVAAPLEPTQPEILTFKGLNLAQWAYIVVHPSKLLDHGFKSVQQFLREFCEAYAAAGSKNLQQSVEQLCGDVQAIQKDYTNEKKRAENLQEELARAENYLNGRECARCGSKVSGSDWKAALRYMGQHSVRCVGCHGAAGAWRPYGIMGLQARILELEKEIAALRNPESQP